MFLSKNLLYLYSHYMEIGKKIQKNHDQLCMTILIEKDIKEKNLFLSTFFGAFAALNNKEKFNPTTEDIKKMINFINVYWIPENYTTLEGTEKKLPNPGILTEIYGSNSKNCYSLISAAFDIIVSSTKDEEKVANFSLIYHVQLMMFGMQCRSRLIMNIAMAKISSFMSQVPKMRGEKDEKLANAAKAIEYFTGSVFNESTKEFGPLWKAMVLSRKKLTHGICKIFLWAGAFTGGLFILPMIIPFFGIVFTGESIAILVGIAIGFVTLNYQGIVNNVSGIIKWNAKDIPKIEFDKHQMIEVKPQKTNEKEVDSKNVTKKDVPIFPYAPCQFEGKILMGQNIYG